MMNIMQFSVLISFLFAICGCEKGCSGKSKTSNGEVDGKFEAAELPKNIIRRFDRLRLDHLNQRQLDALTTLFNEEICPCGCPKTFAQCLTMKSGCKAGELLAQWTADKLSQIRENEFVTYLFKSISEEINLGYLSEPIKVDTKDAHQKGEKTAPMVIVEFADFECPACKVAALEMKQFIKENSKDVQLYFMHFPLPAHPNALRAALAAEAAGKQGSFWKMHDLLFSHEGPLTEEVIQGFAKQLFDAPQLAKFNKDLADPAILQKIKDHREYGAKEIKLQGTPTFLFNGRPYNLLSSKDGYELRLAMEKLRSEIDCKSDN